jgi:predicted outer membrane repeat protein
MNGGTISGNTSGSGGGVYVLGTFTMSGGIISENISTDNGGGVYVDGTFTMSEGDINGNTTGINGDGGGVYVKGTFTMSGGRVSGNTGHFGGGVNATTFTMRGGVISRNTARYSGGGVWVNNGTFTKSGGGGVIYGSNAEYDQANRASSDYGHAVSSGRKKRNTTARAATAMDSTKDGPAGGWE